MGVQPITVAEDKQGAGKPSGVDWQMIHSETIDGAKIRDWDSFHDEFQARMGFFAGYGRNLDAWIDCMSDMYTNGEYKSLTRFDLDEGDAFLLRIENAGTWRRNDPESFNTFIEMSLKCNGDKTHFYLELQNNN